MNHTDHIALSSIARMVPYINSKMQPLSQIVAQTAPDLAFTGNFYNENTRQPVCPLKADGKVYFSDQQYNYYVHTWDDGPDLSLVLLPPGGSTGKRNHIANCTLIVDGKPQSKLYYNDDVSGVRGRVAMGTETGYLDVFASSDSDFLAMTPEQLRDYAAGTLHWKTGVMHDGGRKVNYYNKAAGVLIEGKDPSQNLILVYLLKDTGTTETTKEASTVSKKVMLDAGHYTGCPNGSADGTYKEDEFTLDMSKRLGAILSQYSVTVSQTRTGDTYVTLDARWQEANDIKDLDLFVSLHSNASSDTSVSGFGIYTYGAGDTAKRNIAAKDILGAVKEAGIGLWGSGLHYDAELAVLKHTAAPAILIEHGFHTNAAETALLKTDKYRDKLAQADAKGILAFLGITWKEKTALEQAVDQLAAAGVIDNPDYWKAGNYSAETVEKLLVKMAAAL